MVEELLDNTKLIKVPRALANQLKLVSGRLGTSVTDYASEALNQALRVDDMGANLTDAVDMLELVNIHKGAGFVNLPRTSFNYYLNSMSETDPESEWERWLESGRWYASYLLSKLSPDGVLNFLEGDLRILWNLDETEIIVEDVMVHFRACSFNMSATATRMLALYTKGIFQELGYSINDEDILPGLISFKFIKILK